jgi:hypothetical protein
MRWDAALSLLPRSGIESRRVILLAVIVVGAKDKWKSGENPAIPRLGVFGRVVEKFCASYPGFPHD